jgi:hypothetical protein
VSVLLYGHIKGNSVVRGKGYPAVYRVFDEHPTCGSLQYILSGMVVDQAFGGGITRCECICGLPNQVKHLDWQYLLSSNAEDVKELTRRGTEFAGSEASGRTRPVAATGMSLTILDQ